MTEYRTLGASALKVSRLSLGTMMFGGPTDEPTSRRIIDAARDHGINFIDTADVYNKGVSEEIVGRSVKTDRDDWVIATKFVNPAGAGPNAGGYSRKWVHQAVEASLRRLDTDYVDIIYFHRAIFTARPEEPLRAIADLIAQGKLRYFGVSNFRGWRIAQISHLADQLGIDRPVVSQPLYNIVNRTAEVEQIPAAAAYGLGVVPYSPLARGVLTAKYAADAAPAADSRAGRGDKRIAETEWRPESIAAAQKIKAHLAGRGLSPAEFAVAWVLANPYVTAAIAGPRTEDQWQSYLRALDAKISPDDEALIDVLVPAGHASTHGFTDPGHPLEGRPPAASGGSPLLNRSFT
ncbi:MAG: aldo/keto reductase [Devosia sp.]|uniref:aldo/keto reductase n=1 Tax=Devosia sp. TaxID=1871048 RepID=UPI0024C6D1BE|nr:aldo/keto reductase [Devosia sp.]UYN99131.1 MAG: aldo/keto reductase [Devosia sp.]